MNKDTRDVIIIATGFVFGTWLHYLYREGGWDLVLTDWWKGLGAALLFLAVVFVWGRIKKRK